jgi:predicted nucleotide-binding protein
MNKPHAIIFSSRKSLPVAEGVKLNLEPDFTADTWTENFFDAINTPPLNTFLKKLLCYDLAVLVLGDDDIQLQPDGATQVFVPRDNVIFELGATMARMGTQKTFLLAPEDPPVKLPSYFKGLDPLTYQKRDDGNFSAGTGAACIRIRDRIRGLEQDAFHSDLPALGLAQGYFFNFVLPIHNTLRENQAVRFANAMSEWKPEHGFG